MGEFCNWAWGCAAGGGGVEWPVTGLCSVLGRSVVGEFCSCWAWGHAGGLGWGVEWLATGLCNVLGGVLLAKRCSSG